MSRRAKITPAMQREIRIKYNYTCLCCGQVESERVGMVIDHVIPLYMGGINELDNLQLLCSPCFSATISAQIDFRDPNWRDVEQHWSVAEQAVRAYLTSQGRPAWHPTFSLNASAHQFIELWDCLGYERDALEEAIARAAGLGYSYPGYLPIANDILHGRGVRRKETRGQTHWPTPTPPPLPALPPPALEPPPPPPPNRVRTKLGRGQQSPRRGRPQVQNSEEEVSDGPRLLELQKQPVHAPPSTHQVPQPLLVLRAVGGGGSLPRD